MSRPADMSRLDALIEGLRLLDGYGAADVCADHDVIYAGADDVDVSDVDRSRLIELGWHLDKDVGSWAFFT